MKLSGCPTHKSIFLGVDQTGALRANGRYRPLPACLIQNDTASVAYLEGLSLASLSAAFDLDPGLAPDAVAVDAVLGLPLSVGVPWRAAVSKAAAISSGGRSVAANFFRELGRGQVHWRKTDRQSGAQSLFLEKPFQRNVQTGSFRIWQDIGRHPGEFYVPAIGEIEGRVPLYEGYPSLAWRLLTGCKRRDLRALHPLSTFLSGVKIPPGTFEQIQQDPNLADALMLALQLRRCHPADLKFRSSSEGKILGADAKSELLRYN